MDSSDTKYISVSSPRTYNMNKIHVPPKVLRPPVFQPASWERKSLRKGDFSYQESDSQSLLKERQYQLELQQRIVENEELVGLYPDELENDSLEEDSLEEISLEEERAERDTNGKQNNFGSGRKQQPGDKYCSLRYDPDWKKTKKGAELSGAEKASQVSGGSSMDTSLDSFYLHSDDSSEEKNQQEAKTKDSFSEFGSELSTFHEPNVVVSSEPAGPQAKRKEPAADCHSKDSPGMWGLAFPLQVQQKQTQRAKKNFVTNNKRTLGLHSEKINSYLQLHNKKQQVIQGQGTDPKPVDEESLQSVPAFQTVKMKPEHKWYPKGQQLKEQHNNFSQGNKIDSNQSLNGRAFPKNDQQPPGRPAEPKSWPSHQQIPGFQSGEHNSSALQECLNPGSSVGPDTDPAEKSKTCLNTSQDSRHFVKPDFTSSTYPWPPTSHHVNPAEIIYPANTSKENRKYQHDSPNGIPHDQQPGQHFGRDNSTNGQAHPKQGNISSDFNASFQERVKDQVPLPDVKNHIHEDSSSPTASCGTSQFAQMLEQHPPGISGLAGVHFADRWLWNLLPPALSQVPRDSQGDPGGGEGNPGKMSRSSSEGHLLQMEKQTQPKVSKKPCSSNLNINLNVKLGGLGPDYEAIKEKKQKLKLQKEYSRQIKEYNMKNITFVQRLPEKPQVIPSVTRQKALEYAKKIPKPKTFMTRPSGKEVEKKGILPQTRNGSSLPKIPSLETLWNRHEKEKEVVAAFQTLHIL